LFCWWFIKIIVEGYLSKHLEVMELFAAPERLEWKLFRVLASALENKVKSNHLSQKSVKYVSNNGESVSVALRVSSFI
jgi:hypothetical protein